MMAEVVMRLRPLDFPACADAALEWLAGQYTASPGTAIIPSLGIEADKLADDVAAEFIFCQFSPKGHTVKISALQELQLLDVLLQFYTRHVNEPTRDAIFRTLFYRVQDDDVRSNVMCKLTSLAIGTANSNLLNSAAVWMQNHGCGSVLVEYLTVTLVHDYCILAPGTSHILLKLPAMSAHFTCNFVTAVTSHYCLPGSKNKNKPVLPLELLSVMVEWLSTDPNLCLTSLCNTSQPFTRITLWTSPTKPHTQTPVPGLVRWCTMAPLLAAININNGQGFSVQWKSLWSRLHASVLQTLLSFPALPGSRQLELLTLADMTHIVKHVCLLIEHVRQSTVTLRDKLTYGTGGAPTATGDGTPIFKICQQVSATSGLPSSPAGDGEHLMQMEEVSSAVDQLIQVLQVALATGAFRCSLGDLRGICQLIPPCRLLAIVQNEHLSCAPPPMHNAAL